MRELIKEINRFEKIVTPQAAPEPLFVLLEAAVWRLHLDFRLMSLPRLRG